MNPPLAKIFVLGCSRLGSTLTLLNHAQSLALIRRAYELGVRHFDTASIYGQGDSERLLGEALQPVRADVCISTKAGQKLMPSQRLLRPFKPLIRGLIRRQSEAAPGAPSPARPPAAAGMVAAQRARGVAYAFDQEFILKSLDGSLRRLRSNKAELFYLHSPPPHVLAEPALWNALEGARQAGRISQLGVSCDDLDTAEAALACRAVQVVQFEPDDSQRSAALLKRAAANGVAVYARVGARRAGGAQSAIQALLQSPAVSAVLMGTTNADHLAENLKAFEAACSTMRAAKPS